MKKLFPLVFFLAIFACKAQSQTYNDTISIVGNHYQIGSKVIKKRQVMQLMRSDPESYLEMKKASLNRQGATICALAGGFFIGYPIGQSVAGTKPDWWFAGIGAGLVLFTIPYITTCRAHTAKAVRVYNAGIRNPQSGMFRFDLGLSHNGVSLTCTF